MAEKTVARSKSQTTNNSTGKRRGDEARSQPIILSDSSEVTASSSVHSRPQLIPKRNTPNSNTCTTKKPKLSTENTIKPLKRKPQLQQNILTKKPNVLATDLPLKSPTLSNKKAQASTESRDLGTSKGNPNKRLNVRKHTKSRSRPLSTEFSLSSTSPPVLLNLRHSWHGMPAGLKAGRGYVDAKSNPQRQRKAKLAQKGVRKTLCGYDNEDLRSEDETEILDLFPNERRILFNSLSVWLEMAEKRLELIERDLNEEPDDGHLLQRTKKTFQVFKEETRLQEFKLTMIRQTCDSAIGIPGEDYRIAIRKWEVIKRKVTIHEQRLTLMSQGSGNLSKLYYWLNEAEALLESYENVQENDGITSLRCRMERHKDFFKILDEKRHVIEDLQQRGTDGNVDIDEGVIWDVSQRFQTVEQSSQAAADRLSMEYYKNKVGQCIELCKEQLLDDNLKFGSQSQAEEAFNQHLNFFHEKRYIRKLSAYCKKLKDAVEKCRPVLSEEEQNDINQHLQNISKDFEDILQRMQADEQKLENIHRCWSEFSRAVELSLPWLVEAERLLKEGEPDQCRDYFMDFEDAQHDVTKATDSIKFLKRHSCGTVNVTLEQQVAMLDRRLRRVTRRYTRFVKSKHRDPKLESYECCVDEMMDWLDQSELAVNDDIDIGRLERLQEQVCTCEVLLDELNNNVSGVETVNDVGKDLMHDKNIASSIKATILNVNRRFDKLKTALPQKHKKLKQLQRLVHNVTSGLDEIHTWSGETAKLLEKNLLFEDFEEVKHLYEQYETQMADYEKHAEKMKSKNNVCSQIQNIVGEDGLHSYKKEIEKVNESWTFVQEHAETQHAKVRHAFITWERFEKGLARLRDISRSTNKDENGVREGEDLCKEILQRKQELCSILEDEIGAKRVEEDANRVIEEWKRAGDDQKLVEWLTEVNSVFQEPLRIDSLENVEREIENHCRTKKALQDRTQAIEETVANANDLEEAGTLSETDIKGCMLEEMWDGTQESFSKRTQELEECVCLWTSYEENMLHVMSSLTKGEMLLADAKSSHESTKDVLENLVDQIEAEKIKLQNTGEILKNMAMTAEKLKAKATSSGAAAIETKLNDATRLHNFLLEEVEHHSDVLKDKIEKWETLHTRIQDLTSWVDATEEKLEMLKRSENLDGHSLTSIKEISTEILQRRQCLENLTEDGYEILDGCIDTESMDTKKHLINLRQRWDALYQTTMECEVKTEVGLKPLQKFQVVCDEFEKWLETVEEKLERQMIKVGSTQELKQQLEACQVLADDLTSHTKNLDDLIWQGSQISSSGKLFSHSELKTKLKVVDQRWQTSRTKVEERVAALRSIQDDFTDKELRFLEICDELDKIKESVRQEQLSEERTKETLENFWEIYEDAEEDISKLNEVLEPTVISFEEFGQQYNIIDSEKLHERCNKLETKWREIRTVLPQRVTAVREEIVAWSEFYEKLEEFQLWLEEVKEMCDEWKIQENSAVMIQNLEKLQAGFRERQSDFEALVEESRHFRETVGDENERERLTATLTNLTQSWDEYSRWAAGRYQLTVLSNHYQKSSAAVVKYLDKIQSKMNAIEIPKTVAEKINEESKKAKVLVQDWNEKCQDLDVVFKDGHVMLEQKSLGESLAFDEELKNLDDHWKQVLNQVETQKHEVEVTARKWWDFTRNKMKMMRWLHRKENDAGLGEPLASSVENPQEQLNNFEDILERISVRKSDLQMLNDAASSILETDPDEDVSEFLNTVNERFVNLESEVARKRDYFGDLVKRWDKFSDRKRRVSELFRGTSCVIAKKQIRTRDDVREQLVRCREAIVHLQSSETELSEVAEQGGKLISELRNEGINVDKIEHELHTVVNRYNEMKNRAIKKEEVLQHVSVEMEKIDEGKMELESWLTDVHQQLNSVDEVAIVSQAIQHEVLEKRSLIRSVSAQVLKLQESSNEEAELDLTGMLQPLHVQWRSLQNLVNPQNSSSESEQNIPSRWKSYSQDDLGSLDAFSEGLGLSRDDVMESGTELMFEDYYDGDLDNWINRLNEFRECLHGYMYSPEDALFEVEQKLNIVQKNLREELSSMMSDFEQERLQNSAQEKDEDVIKETDNKLREIDSLFVCIASELERIELELQTVYECHVDYETAVQDWLTWFAEAKNKLSGCQMEETNEQSIDRKDQVIQSLSDEMDQVDLIDDVYTKGETLLNTVSDPVKTKLENQLAEFENDWAEFCGSVTECSNKIKEELKRQQALNDWKEFNENSEAITTELKHFESLLSEEVPAVNSLDDVSEMLLKIQDVSQGLENERSKYEELKTRSVEISQDAEIHNQTANKVESIDTLFNKVLQQAVVKQHSLEKAAVQLQHMDTGIKNLTEVVEEMESMLSPENTEMSDADLRENIELYQTNLEVLESQKELIEILKQKEMSSMGKESKQPTSKLQEVVEKWTKVYEMTNERKAALIEEIESRESRQKTLNECVVTLRRAHEVLNKDVKQCLSINEVESIRQALTELESSDATLNVLQSEINSNENKFSSAKTDREEVAAIISQCKAMKTSLSNKLEKLETILRQENEFNTEVADLLKWISSTENALVVDFYGLSEEERQTAAVGQEKLAKEFSAKKESVEKLLRTGSELKSVNAEKISENVASKMAELSEKWKELEQIFSAQEEHVEECLRQQQAYYDAVEQLWEWMQGIGKRLNIQMEKSKPNYEQELAEYFAMVREIRDKSLLFENILKSGEKLSELLCEEEGSEIQEQLERLTSEWEILKSQVVERSRELTEILGHDAWLKVVQGNEEMLEELRALGIFEKRLNDNESELSCSSNDSELSVKVSARETELNRMKRNVREEDTNQIIEPIVVDNSVPDGNKSCEIDSHDGEPNITDGTEAFVQILVLPTDNDETVVDSPADTDTSREDYLESCAQVPVDINSNTIESPTEHSDAENTEDSRAVVDLVPRESAPDQTEVFINQIKDSEEFLAVTESKLSQLNEREGSEAVILELVKEFSDKDQEFENVLEIGMGLVRDISEDEQFAVEEKIITVEDRWKRIKDGLFKRKEAVETVSMLENRLQEFAKFVDEISEYLSGKEATQEWLYSDEEAGSIVECYLGRLEREQIALKGLIEGTRDTLANVPRETGKQIEERLSRVSENQTELARQLHEMKTALERWFEFSLILEGVEREVEALTSEFKDLADGEETEIIMESHLIESRVHMLKILLGSLEGKANTLRELSTKYKDVISSSNDCGEKYKKHKQNIAEKIALVADRLEKLDNYLESFKELEVEANELQVEVRQADEALSTLGENLSTFDEVDSRVSTLERLSEIKHLEEDILRLEPRVQLVKEKSMERLDKLDYENSGYWFQENVQCLVSGYEKARTRVKKNLESIEQQVSLKDQFEMKFLEMTAFLGNVEEYLNEDEEIPGNFDVTAKEVALLNGERFLREMELKERSLGELVEIGEKLSEAERNNSWKEEALQLKERFNTRLKELRKNISCLDETLKCFNDFEQKVEELASLMHEAQGFLYGEGVETRGLIDLLELGRSCLENVEHKEGTLLELKNRVERLTESFKEEEKEVIIAEVMDLENKLASVKMSVVNRISSLEALSSRRDVYQNELDEVRHGISSLEQEMKRNDGLGGESKPEVFSSLQKDQNPEESLSTQIPDEILLREQTNENFSQKLEEFRARLQNLNKMKTELEEECEESKVELDNVLALEPLELTVADLERIDQEKANELRKYEEEQILMSAKVYELEEKFRELKTQYEEDEVHPEIVLETSGETNVLLQDVENALVDVGSVTTFTEERAKMVERLEAIRNDCVEMQKRLIGVNSLQLSEDCNSTPPQEMIKQQDSNTDSEAIHEVILPPPFDVLDEATCSNTAYNVNMSDSPLSDGLNVTDNSLQHKLDKKIPASSENQEPTSQNDFQVLQGQVDTLANDEEILDIIISNSDVTSGSVSEKLETAKAKLELVKEKESHLQIITSQAASMWDGIQTKSQGLFEENVIEVKEKLATAEECLMTRIKMLEQCVQTKAMLQENLLDCYEILEGAEGEKHDLATVKEYVQVLQDPNNCLENASRLCFALNVVGDFEEAGRVKEEIQDLRERWEKALEHAEQQVKEVTELDVSTEETLSINSRNEDPREDIQQQHGHMENTILLTEQQENTVDENVLASNAGSRENVCDVSQEFTVEVGSTLEPKQPENLGMRNVDEGKLREAPVNGEDIERTSNVIAKIIVADENEHVTLDCINDKPNDDFPEEFMVKEIPFEDGAITIKAFELQVNTAKRTLPEKQIQDIMEENIVAPSIADGQENKAETGLNGYQTIATVAEFNLRDSAVPSFLCLGSDEEIYKESKALEIEDVHHTLNKIQTAKERLQELTEKEEKIQKLSYEISELERRTLVPFKQTTHTDNTECWKFEEEIQKARNRLQKICNEIKSAFPELETHPANSRENELLRRSEYLLKEIDELTERRSSMETIAECEKFVEEVKNVCDKPMTFCLDVVKMKKELAELGTISLELKDKEAKLQKVQLPNEDRATELSASLRHYAKVLETNEETMAGFLSALRHVLRSIQELKRITQDEKESAENIQDIEVKCKNLEAKITEIESLERKVQQLSGSLPTKENDVLQRQVFTLKSDLKLKMEQIENDRKRIDFERRLETLENNLTAFEDGMTKTDGNTADFMKAFSEQFALVSEEVSQLADEGESLLSNDNANADGALSAKLQDVRSRFLRIQDLVEKQNEFERFENAAEDYRGKFDAVNSEISSDAQDIGNTRGSDKQEQLACLDEDFKALQQLAQEIIPSMSEQESTKINALLDELRISSHMLKRRISREQNALVGEPRDAKGLGKGIPVGGTKDVVEEDVCYNGETGTAMRFSDDSDEEHRMLRGSSDGSQYGSDSGMGDSLMNTLASEFTDGPSKTPTVSPINNIAQKEMDELSDRDTLCGEHSPINEHDIDRIVLTAQHIEDNAILNNIAQNPHPASHESSATVLRTHPSILGEMMKRDPGSESDSLEYLSLPQATVDKVTQPQDNIDDLELRTAPNENAELSDKTSSDSQPFIPAEFLLPEPAYQNQQDTRTVLSEQTPDEIIPSEQGSSQGSVENHCPQKSRDHDIDEELLLRSLASENANTNGGVGEGQGVVNGTEFPLISCAPPPMKSVEEFVEEPDALFQRLVDIEVMLKPQGKDEENLKSALLKHVALCVEMKNIQSKINVINRHGQYFMKKARSGLREILEERLKALNSQWDKLQEHASARQKDLEQLVQDKADNEVMSGEDSSLNALRNNTALLSSLYFNTENEDIKRLLNKLGLFSGGEDDNESQRHFDDDYLDYQSAFHDLFEWLTATEEDIQSVSTAESEVKEMRERVKGLQDLWREIQRKKPQLNEMVKKSEKFLHGSGENNEENVSELRHLWRDVMLKACSKLRDLQSVLHTAMMKELNIDAREEFSKTLSECEVDVRDVFERLQECCSVDASEHPLVAAAQYQVFSSEADWLTNVLDSLKTSSHFTQSSSAVNQLSNQIANVKSELESWRKRLNEAGVLQNPVTTDLAEEDVRLETTTEEPRSPRHRPKTWPEHSSLLLQVMEEVKKFEDWLKTAEENLQTFIGIAIPQTLNEMKSKLKEVQLMARNVHNKVTEMEYTLNSLTNSKDEKEYPKLSEKCQNCLNRAKELKNRSDTRTSELRDIRFQWEMFESRFTEMIQWLDRTRENLILPLKEKDEDSIEFVLGKLLKVREIEKKLAEKVTVKDDVLRQGEHVHTKTEAADVNVKIEQLREEWVGIENDLSKERGRLERIMRLWNDYERKQEEMYEWLSGILSSLRALEHQEKTIDVVRSQISLIQKHHDEIDNHLTLKESVDLSFHFLVDNIQGDVERLQHKQQKLNAHWQELQALVSDRFDELVAVEWELEKANMATSLGELHNSVETVRKLVLAEVPLIGSSSLEEIKSLVVKYQNAKRELRSKQSKVDELRRKSRSENMDEERCATLRQLIAQLGEDWEEVTSSLNEKEKSLKTSLDKWIDFQGQLTHLVDTDSWFATREAAMSKYQHISTEKDRNIALEDVKAMKGFLVTQKMSVTAFVESARSLLTDGLYDSDEIEGILGDIEERWMDINTKVNDCEEWLSEMSMKHKSCRDSIGSIMTFLDETELMLQSLASSGGDFDSLISIRTKLSNLESELNGLRSTVYNLNSILVELNNVCDDSIIYELEKDIQELNQRYGSIGQKIKKHKAQNEEMISAFEAFNKDCTEMLAWLQCQNDVLDRENEEPEPPLLASELAQLKQCEELQREVDRQHEFLAAVRSHGQELKSKIKQGSLFVSPKLEKLEQRFNDFSTALNEKQERLKMRTSSWLQFCDKLQILDERIKESERETYTTRYRDTKEHYRLLQKLIREAIQMRPELEELVEFTEENFHDKNSEQGKSARNEVEDLRERLEILTAELDSKKSEVETVQKLQAKFQEQCRHLNAVLQDAEGKLRNGDNAEHFHEQDQSFEFFQSNSEKYKDELLCAQRLAETLDQNTNVDSSTRLEVEAKFNDLKQRWENTCRSVQKHKESMDSRLVKWRDFKQKHKAFVNWLSEFESRPGLQPVASSDITELESQVEYVEACRKELDSHRGEFDLLRSTTEQCLSRSNDTVTDAVEKEYHEAEQRWLRVSECVASNQRTLELTLGDWQEYTTVMEDTMNWLRQTELYLKTCSAASLSDVEKYYERLKELSAEIEERRPHLELLTQRGRRLSRMSSYANADHINNQVSVMGTLWTNVCTCLSTKMHCTIDSLHYLRKFMDNFESLSSWLHRLEDIVRRDWKHFYSCSPEEQRSKIKAYRKEIESHEAQRSAINDSTLQLIDKELGNELLRHIMEQRDALNERWEALCIQLGISYKKAEQTKYSLKLLEAQLTQLNKWMSSVERQITEISGEVSCDIDELSQQLVDLQISQRDINVRSPDVISVLSLCVRLQSCAFPDESGSRELQMARDSFELRWKNISRNVGHLLRQNQERVALSKEFKDDYKQFVNWLRSFENQVMVPSGRCEDLHELSLEISRLQDLKRQVGAKGVLVERLLTRGNCLVNKSASSSAQLIRQMIAKVQERWYGITQELDDSITKYHLLSKDFVEFEEGRRGVNAWLTDVEVRLIGLEQVGNEIVNEEQRLQELKTLQHHINMKHGSLSELTSQITKLKGCCSVSDYRLQQQKVEELKLRYEQALHYSLTLMLDLAVPSPFSSPDRVSTRLNFSETKP